MILGREQFAYIFICSCD